MYESTRILIGIEDAEDVDGVGRFIDGKGDQEGKALHGFAADVLVPGGSGGGKFGDARKILGD